MGSKDASSPCLRPGSTLALRGWGLKSAFENSCKVSMIALGELCGLPKRQLATGFGFKTRKSSYDSRNAVLTGAPQDLLPKRTGPHTRSQRTKEVEALIIRTRFETDGNMDEIAAAFTALGFPVSARLVGRVLADYGLSKKNG